MHVSLIWLPHGAGLDLPRYATSGSAGVDLPLAEELTLAPGARALASTGLALAIPAGFEGQIRPRSGLSITHGLTVLNAPGTIDSDYRGEIKVPLINLGQAQLTLTQGQRIAQVIFAPVVQAQFCLRDDLGETARGAGGFGSTGD